MIFILVTTLSSVNASVNNLFDTRYFYSEGFIEEGRNFWAGVEYKF